MSASIPRYMCLSTALTDGLLIKNKRKGRKELFLQELIFSFVQVVCMIFFLGFQEGKRLSWRVDACLEEFHKLHIFFCYICLSVKKQLLVNIRHCLKEMGKRQKASLENEVQLWILNKIHRRIRQRAKAIT